MKTFKKLWTKEFVESVLDAFEKSDNNYLCSSSKSFERIWDISKQEIINIAVEFINKTDNKLGSVCSEGFLLFYCHSYCNVRNIRIQFLKHEIERLSK